MLEPAVGVRGEIGVLAENLLRAHVLLERALVARVPVGSVRIDLAGSDRGEQRLIDLVRDNRDLPLPQISQIVTLAVDDWIGDEEQPDDVTLVLARAR